MHIMEFAHSFKEFIECIAALSVDFLELLSIGIIVVTTFVAFYKLIRKDPTARIYLLHGQSVGLTFKLGSEILRTITVRNMDEILQIAMLIAIKAAMTWLIHWELADVEEEEEAEKPRKKKDSSLTDRVIKVLHPEINEPNEKSAGNS